MRSWRCRSTFPATLPKKFFLRERHLLDHRNPDLYYRKKFQRPLGCLVDKDTYHQAWQPKLDPWTHMVERENHLLQVILWPLWHVHNNTYSECECVRVYVCVCKRERQRERVRMNLHVEARGQPMMSFFRCHLLCFWDKSSQWPRTAGLLGLAGQQALEACPPPSPHWSHVCDQQALEARPPPSPRWSHICATCFAPTHPAMWILERELGSWSLQSTQFKQSPGFFFFYYY